MTTAQIKNELKEVRFYYANKDMFERAGKITPAEATLSIVNKYNNAISKLYIRICFQGA